MSEDDSSSSFVEHSEKKRGWLERLTSAFSGEPHTRDELVAVLHTAQEDGLIAADTLRMMEGAISVAELTAVLQSSQPKISRHLKVLAESGLARCRRDGLWAFYSAAVGRLPRMLQALSGMAAAPEFADDERRAAEVLAERAAPTRRFFNEVAHDWPRLSREILGGLDLSPLFLMLALGLLQRLLIGALRGV